MPKPAISLLALIFLSGCINFNPGGTAKQRDDEQSSEVYSILAEPEVLDHGMTDTPTADMAVQNASHLKFKGVPIDGTLGEFVARMQRSGFDVSENYDGQAVLTGDFAGFKNCIVHVETLTGKDLVSHITVRFPEQDQWQYLYGDYRHLKGLLSAKYGNPSSCVEEFQGIFVDDDRDKMYEVIFDRCRYETRFSTDKGEIVLWIGHSGSEGYVVLAYKDRINGNKIKQHAIDDL